MVQWLGLGTFTVGARVESLVRELRSCKPRGVARKKKKKMSNQGQSRLISAPLLGHPKDNLSESIWIEQMGK